MTLAAWLFLAAGLEAVALWWFGVRWRIAVLERDTERLRAGALELLLDGEARRRADAEMRLAAVGVGVRRAEQVSPSDRMTVYVGDLQHALGVRDQPARTKTGSDDA